MAIIDAKEAKEILRKLEERRGEEVTVVWVPFPSPTEFRGKLKEAEGKDGRWRISLDTGDFPIIGEPNTGAIARILGDNGELLFENPLFVHGVPPEATAKDIAECKIHIERLRSELFGGPPLKTDIKEDPKVWVLEVNNAKTGERLIKWSIPKDIPPEEKERYLEELKGACRFRFPCEEAKAVSKKLDKLLSKLVGKR